MAAQARHEFATLNALRGIAAMAVVVGHLHPFVPRVASGLFAVDLFFVMSGFVIAHAYEKRLAHGMTARQFAKVRAIRLYPIYAIGVLLGLLVWLLAAEPLPQKFESSVHALVLAPFGFAMIPAPGSEILFPLDPVAWSLFFEVLINAVYALTWRLWSTRRLLIWLPVSAILAVAAGRYFGFDSGWARDNALGGLARVCFGFPLGVLLYRLWVDGKLVWTPSWVTPLVLGMLCMIPLHSFLLHTAVLLVLVPATVVAAVNRDPPRLLVPLARFLGDTSYAIYALHLPLIWCLLLAFRPSESLHSGLALIGAMLVAAWVVHRFVDTPVRRGLTKFVNRKPSVVPA